VAQSAREICPPGGTVRGKVCDVADAKAGQRLVDEVVDEFGRIDTLVNCAGVNKRMKVEEYDEETYDFITNINIRGAFFLSLAAGRYLDFQAEYLRLFEVGMGIPPCPLYGGLYRGGRKAVMEELTRFYNFFGLSVEQGKGELPDHVSTELEFMHFLTFKELTALRRRDDPAPYRRAQRDFLERQLVSWLPDLEARLNKLEAPPFYAALTMLTNAFARSEHTHLRHEAAGAAVAARMGG